ncbi:MAG: hypothetical protein ABJH45_05130 [Paracoccaceae bacterium]
MAPWVKPETQAPFGFGFGFGFELCSDSDSDFDPRSYFDLCWNLALYSDFGSFSGSAAGPFSGFLRCADPSPWGGHPLRFVGSIPALPRPNVRAGLDHPNDKPVVLSLPTRMAHRQPMFF